MFDSERLKWLMEQRGMLLTDLSRASELSQQYISNLLHGHKYTPSLKALQALARALDTTVSFLIGETDDPDVWDPETQVPRALQSYLRECGAERARVTDMVVEQRFAFLVHFMKARFHRHVDLLKLAYQLGVSPSGLSELLSGRVDVSRFALAAITKITGVHMEFFATGDVADIQVPQARPGERS